MNPFEGWLTKLLLYFDTGQTIFENSLKYEPVINTLINGS